MENIKERVQYHIDSFIDFEGKEHKFVIAAVSTILPRRFKDYSDDYYEGGEKEFATLYHTVECYVEGYGVEDDSEDEVVKKVSVGFSICNPEDEFDENIGKLKAYNRAKNSDAVLYATKSGMINTKVVTALLIQESEYFKENPGSQIKGYRDKMNRYLDAADKKAIWDKIPTDEKNLIKRIANMDFDFLKKMVAYYKDNK